jgi:hypothetical protein
LRSGSSCVPEGSICDRGAPVTPTAVDARPRRLVLSAAELELITRHAGTGLPAGFVPAEDLSEDQLVAAAASLAGRGVLTPDPSGDPLGGQVHPSVLADLVILAAPAILVETQARLRDVVVIATHALGGFLGASLVHLGAGRVELSMFPPQGIGTELERLVPEIPETAAARRTAIVSVDALTALGAALEAGGDAAASQLTREQGWPAEDLAATVALGPRLAGSLRCLVTVRADGVRGPGLAQVVWLATAEGWMGLQPEPGPPGTRSLRLVPVDRADLGAWVAPLFAEGLG